MWSVGNIHASWFSMDLIDKEDENINMMPNITTSSNCARPIGTAPMSSLASTGTGISPEAASVVPLLSTAKSSNNCLDITPSPGLMPISFHYHSCSAAPNSNVSSFCPSSEPHYIADGSLKRSRNATYIEGEDVELSTKFSPSSSNGTLTPTSRNHFVASSERSFKKIRQDIHIFEEDLESYIQAEIKYCGFSKAAKQIALRNVIEFIANNDYEGFLAYKYNFVNAFNFPYHLFKRGASNKFDYMMHYIIRFGATNFIDSWSYSRRIASKESNIGDAFKHLIATKSVDVVIAFLRSGHHLNQENVMNTINTEVKIRHPNLHFFDYIVFELDLYSMRSVQFEIAVKIFESTSEEMKLCHLTEFLASSKRFMTGFHIKQTRLLEIPIRFEKYFMSLDIELQFYLAQLAILGNDLEKLTTIIELVPALASYNSNSGDTLFSYATRFIGKYSQILQFFTDIVIELVNEGENSPLLNSIKRDDVDNLKIYEAGGFDFTQKLQYKGQLMTSIQLSFELRKLDTFNFLLNKIGAENVLDEFMQIYGSRNEIMSRAMRHISTDLVKILRDKLGFDLNAEYTFKSKTGNVLVFIDNDNYDSSNFKVIMGL